MELCHQLRHYLLDATRLLLYIDYIDLDDFYSACRRTKLLTEEAIITKCGNVTFTILYLLSFKQGEELFLNTLNLDPTKMYSFTLIGQDEKELLTIVGHTFILIFLDNQWVILDSYILCRGFTCRPVDNINVLLEDLLILQEEYNPETWWRLTGCHEEDKATKTISYEIVEYNYNLNEIEEAFHSLVQKAKNRLANEEIGIDDDHLVLLSSERDPEEAREYLESLSKF